MLIVDSTQRVRLPRHQQETMQSCELGDGFSTVSSAGIDGFSTVSSAGIGDFLGELLDQNIPFEELNLTEALLDEFNQDKVDVVDLPMRVTSSLNSNAISIHNHINVNTGNNNVVTIPTSRTPLSPNQQQALSPDQQQALASLDCGYEAQKQAILDQDMSAGTPSPGVLPFGQSPGVLPFLGFNAGFQQNQTQLFSHHQSQQQYPQTQQFSHPPQQPQYHNQPQPLRLSQPRRPSQPLQPSQLPYTHQFPQQQLSQVNPSVPLTARRYGNVSNDPQSPVEVLSPHPGEESSALGLDDRDTRWKSSNHLRQVVHFIRTGNFVKSMSWNHLARDPQFPHPGKPKTTHWLTKRLIKIKQPGSPCQYTVRQVNEVLDLAFITPLGHDRSGALKVVGGSPINPSSSKTSVIKKKQPKSVKTEPASLNSRVRSHYEADLCDEEEEFNSHMMNADERPSQNREVSHGSSLTVLHQVGRRMRARYDTQSYLREEREIQQSQLFQRASIGWTLLYSTKVGTEKYSIEAAQLALDTLLVFVKMMPAKEWKVLFPGLIVDQTQFTGKVKVVDGKIVDELFIRIISIAGVHASPDNPNHIAQLQAFDIQTVLEHLYSFGTNDQIKLAELEERNELLVLSNKKTLDLNASHKQELGTIMVQLNQQCYQHGLDAQNAKAKLEKAERSVAELTKQLQNVNVTTSMFKHLGDALTPSLQNVLKLVQGEIQNKPTPFVTSLHRECEKLKTPLDIIDWHELMTKGTKLNKGSFNLRDVVSSTISRLQCESSRQFKNNVDMKVIINGDMDRVRNILYHLLTTGSVMAPPTVISVENANLTTTTDGRCDWQISCAFEEAHPGFAADLTTRQGASGVIVKELLQQHGASLAFTGVNVVSFTLNGLVDFASFPPKASHNSYHTVDQTKLVVPLAPPMKKEMSDVESKGWYVGEMGREQAAKVLCEGSKSLGMFLVRKSAARNHCVISAVYTRKDCEDMGQASLFNVEIRSIKGVDSPQQFYIASNYMCNSIPELVDYYIQHPKTFYQNLQAAREPSEHDVLIPYNRYDVQQKRRASMELERNNGVKVVEMPPIVHVVTQNHTVTN